MNEEQWLPVVGFPGYEVSDQGRVRSYLKMGSLGDQQLADQPQRILCPGIDRYSNLVLYKDGVKHSCRVHRLVAHAFLGECPAGMEVCHNDGDKTNDDACNLRYGTRRENVQDAINHGHRHPVIKKLNLQIARRIRSDKQLGMSNSMLANKYDIDRSTASRIVNNQRWVE